MLRWYLIHTKSSGEMSAEMNLERQGYEVYVPRLVTMGRFGRRQRDRVASLFPRYLFLRLDEGRQSLSPVHSTVGVTNVVRFGARYTVVPDDVVRDLRARADPQSGLHRLSDRSLLAPGIAVRISAGAFDGLEGIFEREAGTERVLVLLKLLGHEASVRVPTEFVLPSLSV